MPPKIELKGKKPKKAPTNPAEAFITGNITSIESDADTKRADIKKKTDKSIDKHISKIDTDVENTPKRGRPPKTTEKKKQYSISIKPSLYEKAKSIAIEKEISVNEVISEALIKYLK